MLYSKLISVQYLFMKSDVLDIEYLFLFEPRLSTHMSLVQCYLNYVAFLHLNNAVRIKL